MDRGRGRKSSSALFVLCRKWEISQSEAGEMPLPAGSALEELPLPVRPAVAASLCACCTSITRSPLTCSSWKPLLSAPPFSQTMLSTTLRMGKSGSGR